MEILSHVRESIIAHANENMPRECCGILFARNGDEVIFDSLRAENREENNSENSAVLADMLALLLRKELIMFGGVEPITEYFALPEFYHFAPTKYSWPVIPASLDINYIFEVTR